MTLNGRKALARARMNERLKKESPSIMEQKSKQIVSNYFKFVHQSCYKKVGLYLSIPREVSTGFLIEQLYKLKVRVFVPHINSHKEKTLKEIHDQGAISKNKMGFKEPLNGKHISVNELDLILVPLLGFDLNGNRLGRGGGFYDQLLMNIKEVKSPLIYGLAFDVQTIKLIDSDPWDIKMNGIISESRFIFFKKILN